jgi:type II secretory pathway component PulF
VAVGEESGRLEEFLAKAADLFEERGERAVQRLVALLEPALIVGFGLVVGFIALALFQAIYGVNAESFR